MNTAVQFESEVFRPFLPEDCQINPQCYGAELAFWLSRQLAQQQIFTSYPNFDDQAWFLEWTTEAGEEFLLRCSNLDGSHHQWRCDLQAQSRGFLGLNKAPISQAQPLLDGLVKTLCAEPAISNIKWS